MSPKTAKSSKQQTDSADKKKDNVKREEFTFGKQSYRLLTVGLVLIGLGFILMAGGGSTDPNEFNEEIFSFRRITLAPLLILAGYVVEIFAIMKRPSNKNQD
ncbi:MAG: DUF3098 domain-containing protein [Bacteroidales bacterium]|nr:DUF3098 domain-containing protein [Bacteroidales bacterium]MCF8328133.1 DUF3098 domain-containing protein [Bacteroidales bacterium]